MEAAENSDDGNTLQSKHRRLLFYVFSSVFMLTIISFVVRSRIPSSDQLPFWIVLSYHKTGHFLAGAILKRVSGDLDHNYLQSSKRIGKRNVMTRGVLKKWLSGRL